VAPLQPKLFIAMLTKDPKSQCKKKLLGENAYGDKKMSYSQVNSLF
jgi:hypothetical protein